MEDQQKIEELLDRLALLLRRQDEFQVEINQLKREIYGLLGRQTDTRPLSKLGGESGTSPPGTAAGAC